MSETNTTSKPLPKLDLPKSDQSLKHECASISIQEVSCRTADTQSLSQSEISALRAFFELLDAWDQEMQHGD